MKTIQDILNSDGYSVPRLEDPAKLKDRLQEIESLQLTSGKSITFPLHLAGGGEHYRFYFLKILQGKKYQNAFEWCAGHGIIGFELLTSNICETLTFSDCYDKSTECCLKSAEELNLKDKVTAYTSDNIGSILFEHKFDLVVGNPPNSSGIDRSHINKYFTSDTQFEDLVHFLRINADYDYSSHKEFFDNIHKFITPTTDILITAQMSAKNWMQNLALGSDLKLINVIDMPPDPSLKIFHFIPN